MLEKLSFFLDQFLKKVDIKRLLKFAFYSSTIAILVLALSAITIEKISYESQKNLIETVVKMDSAIKQLNNTITAFIRRNTDITLSESIADLDAIQNRKELENEFNNDLMIIEDLLKPDKNFNLINDFKDLFNKFINVDIELFKKQELLITLNNDLQLNNQALEDYVHEIIDAVDSASGKIKLKASRSRLAISKAFNAQGGNLTNIDSTLLESLLGQQKRVEKASHQVQLSALQIVQLSRKLSQLNNRDALVSVKDNEIAQEISQIKISLNILSANLKNFPDLMNDVTRVNTALKNLVKILIEDKFSIYNLRTQNLELKAEIESHLNNEVHQYASAMVDMVDKMEDYLDKNIANNIKHTEKITKISYVIIFIVSVFVVVFITTILRTLRHRINYPLSLIGKTVDELTQGKLASRLNEKNFAKDEFWLVAKTFNQFAERNESLINDLSTARDALHENEQRLQAILENALVGIAHLVDRRFVSVNHRFEEMFGYERNSIKGLRTEILFSSQNDFEVVGEQAYSSFRDGSTYRSEWLVQHKNGDEFWCAISAKSIVDGKPELGTIWLYEDISERKRTEEQLRTLANYDMLTGLPNRSLFMDRLHNYIDLAKRQNQMIAVMFIDLDRFKQVNDSLGHEAGDKLLKAVANRLNTCVRSSDTVARLGGDEFTIIMVGLSNKMIPARTADKIIQIMSTPILIDDQEISISPSIGISMYPADGKNVAELVRNADAAMYHAKKQGRNNYQFYADEMNAESLNKLTLETRLHRAIENNEFELYFQKQFNVLKNKLVGYEALIRWHDESGETIPPDVFIPILEDTGMISTVGEWILYEACRCTDILLQHTPNPIRMSINLSARQFQNTNLLIQIENAITKYNLKPGDIALEITETILMTGSQFSQGMLHQLHETGCKIVLDDFGTGYSSLAYLKRFPIDTIKIDRSFIRDILTDPSDAAICDAIRAMAESMNMEVIAEGVETKEQLDYLIANGFSIVQGYYFGKPEPMPFFEPTEKQTKLTLIK